MKSWLECVMLVPMVLHQFLLSRVFLDIWEEAFLLGTMMMFCRFNSHVVIREQICNFGGVVNLRSLTVDSIHSSDHDLYFERVGILYSASLPDSR